MLFPFSATVLPLICTPGPDMLFIASQAISGGTVAGLRATVGVVLGYSIHSLLVALGLAALIATSPGLFEAVRWMGIAYLIHLSYKLARSALRTNELFIPHGQVNGQLFRGFLTSLLNPKGMMIYIAILPQFIDSRNGNVTLQAMLLSVAFMFWCSCVYAVLSVVIGQTNKRQLSEKHRRQIDGAAGAMLLIAAGFMAIASW